MKRIEKKVLTFCIRVNGILADSVELFGLEGDDALLSLMSLAVLLLTVLSILMTRSSESSPNKSARKKFKYY